MHPLTKLLLADRAPSLGVTEPGCIALACATARQYLAGEVVSLTVAMTSGLYKNAFACGIPHTQHTGILYAAALGLVAGDPDKGLLCLDTITKNDEKRAEALVVSGVIHSKMTKVTSQLHLTATLVTPQGECAVTIEQSHQNITKIVVNGKVQLQKEQAETPQQTEPITAYTLAQIIDYCNTVPLAEILPLLEAYPMHMALAEGMIAAENATFCKKMLEENGGQLLSDDFLLSAHALTSACMEGRVRGLAYPAMSICGSGSHGILCTIPLYAYVETQALSEERLCRSTALSYLITMYIKAYSGRLSAFCGCGIAGGTGVAVALCFLMGGDTEALTATLSNMACSITGMVCDGGNLGCVLKAMTALDTAVQCAKLGLAHVTVGVKDGINGRTPEETMRHMGEIADPGMVQTEEILVKQLTEKGNHRGV